MNKNINRFGNMSNIRFSFEIAAKYCKERKVKQSLVERINLMCAIEHQIHSCTYCPNNLYDECGGDMSHCNDTVNNVFVLDSMNHIMFYQW